MGYCWYSITYYRKLILAKTIVTASQPEYKIVIFLTKQALPSLLEVAVFYGSKLLVTMDSYKIVNIFFMTQ